MTRRGPCFHCGINSTPLWRQGPEEKPVLCNACGTRYRVWGKLDNYFPKSYLPKEQPIVSNCVNKHKNKNLRFKPSINDPATDKGEESLNPQKSIVPSKRHSGNTVFKSSTPMGEFHQQLLDEWKRYEKECGSSSEDILLFQDVNNFIPSNEIGLGVVLLTPEGTK